MTTPTQAQIDFNRDIGKRCGVLYATGLPYRRAHETIGQEVRRLKNYLSRYYPYVAVRGEVETRGPLDIVSIVIDESTEPKTGSVLLEFHVERGRITSRRTTLLGEVSA